MLTGKTALITGGGRGIGRAIALVFAQHGARVAVAARTREQVETVAREIGDNAVALVCDVSNPEQVAEIFADIKPDILVNNAGIAESATFVNTSDDMWQRHIAINLSGTFYCTRAALPSMLEKGW
jgi:NAD(P)-dependent dehydrogenase (short-subunit alcohol dehydrogenase family)